MIETKRSNELAKKWGVAPLLHPETGVFYGETEDRIEFIRRRIVGAYKTALPDLVCPEDYAYSKFSRSLTPLHELGGVVKNDLHRRQAVWQLVGTGQIKLEATGSGNGSKQQVLVAAQRDWPECPSVLDMSDAYWAARWGLSHYEDLVDDA